MGLKDYIKKTSKNIPFLYSVLRFFYVEYIGFLCLRNFLNSDPNFIKKNPWYLHIKDTQINKKLPLFRDRENELLEFFRLNKIDLYMNYLKYGFPSKDRYRKNIIKIFEGQIDTDEGLTNAYAKSSLQYSIRLMLGYEKYVLLTPYLSYIMKNTDLKFGGMEVLDYGCGISDIGLLLASLGAEVTLVDLDDKKFDFTGWRFKKRGFNPNIIRIKNVSKFPKLKKEEYDLIIATEIFEHVRNPLKLLKIITRALKKNGFLIDSMGGEFKRDIEGDHLEEAIKIGNSKKYKNYYNRYYEHLKFKNDLNYLYRKK